MGRDFTDARIGAVWEFSCTELSIGFHIRRCFRSHFAKPPTAFCIEMEWNGFASCLRLPSMLVHQIPRVAMREKPCGKNSGAKLRELPN
jgi:hypothetical protein